MNRHRSLHIPRTQRLPLLALLLCTLCTSGTAAEPATPTADELPRSLDARLKVELVLEHPQIVTPTGIDVDHRGRVFVMESNTHFPPAGYDRHPTDRLLLLEQTDADAAAEKLTVFADGFTHAMSVAARPVWIPPVVKRAAGSGTAAQPFQVYVATRREIILLNDDDHDGQADRRETLVRLETPGNYPHNGLAGFAFDGLDHMYFGFGENLGADYTLIGSDGTQLKGGGEGGNLYRCRPDGTELELWATGFWNPHASCMNAFGELFTVDNDPDSRPPCRLLHIQEGGDYGYRFRNGRKGLHPFTAWNGEVPGTLPMVGGTGEAPSGIVAVETDGLPEDYRGSLLVTSWGDHRIDRFSLKPQGASFVAVAEPLIQGGENFRPVGLAFAPDGSLYFSDWVLRDYKVHSHGRVWRVSRVDQKENAENRPVLDAVTLTAEQEPQSLTALLDSPRLDVRRQAARSLSLSAAGREVLKQILADSETRPRAAAEALWAVASLPVIEATLGYLTKDAAPRIQPAQADVAIAATRLIGTPQFPFKVGEVDDRRAFRRLFSADRSNRTEEESARLLAARLRLMPVARALDSLHGQTDPFVISAAVHRLTTAGLTRQQFHELLSAELLEYDTTGRKTPRATAVLLAARSQHPDETGFAELALDSPAETHKRIGIQWIAEHKLSDLRGQLHALLSQPQLSSDLFLAILAALEMLDGTPPQNFDKTPPGKYVLPLVQDDDRPASIRAQALRLVEPADPGLTDDLLARLLAADAPVLRTETVRTLMLRPGDAAARLLSDIARDDSAPLELRADAVAGLGTQAAQSEVAGQTLLSLLDNPEPLLQREAVRSLRPLVPQKPDIRRRLEQLAKQPAADEQLTAQLQLQLALAAKAEDSPAPAQPAEAQADVSIDPAILTGGDAAAGRRAFFHAAGAGCWRCHTVNGRGGSIGPDLSRIGAMLDRKRLAQSILDPAREVAPQFTVWTFLLESGQTHTGVLVGDVRDSVQKIGTPDGKVLSLKADEIEERVLQRTSLMPARLTTLLTDGELKDLLAYLSSLR